MQKKIEKAIENSLQGSIYAFYTLSDLDPPITPDFVCHAEDGKFQFQCVWWDDDSGHSGFDPKVADETMKQIVEEMKAQLASRNVIADLSGKVVQEFNWNDRNYDLDNHGISYAVYIKGEVQEVIGTILKNSEDFGDEVLDRACEKLQSELANYFVTEFN